jgi:hypothetical protein
MGCPGASPSFPSLAAILAGICVQAACFLAKARMRKRRAARPISGATARTWRSSCRYAPQSPRHNFHDQNSWIDCLFTYVWRDRY